MEIFRDRDKQKKNETKKNLIEIFRDRSIEEE